MREFNYLGITSTKSGSLNGLPKERLRTTNIVVRKVWDIEERKFKDNFKRRMTMFDFLVLEVMVYGILLIG